MTAATLTPPQAPARVPDVPSGFELVDGQLVEKPMSLTSTVVAGKVYKLLDDYCVRTGFGVAVVADLGFNCFPHNPGQVWKPDAAVIACDPLAYDPPDGWVTDVPALVVEVVSPNERVHDLNDKIADFRAAGAPLIWVIDPPHRHATVYRADGTLALVTEPADLSGEGVLPGLVVPLAAVLPAVRAAAP